MAIIFGMKHDIDNQQGRWKVQGVFNIVSKCHELWFTNNLK